MHGRENALDFAAIEQGIDFFEDFNLIRHSVLPFTFAIEGLGLFRSLPISS
jgi:hypothetical protein